MTAEKLKFDGEIDRLLHDAERAKGGFELAAMLGDNVNARELKAKWKDLSAEANRLDPDHTAPAWGEADV